MKKKTIIISERDKHTHTDRKREKKMNVNYYAHIIEYFVQWLHKYVCNIELNRIEIELYMLFC